MERSHRTLIVAVIGVLAATLLVVGVVRRPRTDVKAAKSTPKRVASTTAPATERLAEMRQPAAKPVAFRQIDEAKQGKALHDTTLLDLIRNARVAARTGDVATRDAMLVGLRREPARARDLVMGERDRAADPEDAQALSQILSDLR